MTLRKFSFCTKCGESEEDHAAGVKCLYGPPFFTPLTRENFAASHEFILSKMRAAGAPIDDRLEVYKLCPHPSDQVTKSGHKQQCELCGEEWAEPC